MIVTRNVILRKTNVQIRIFNIVKIMTETDVGLVLANQDIQGIWMDTVY